MPPFILRRWGCRRVVVRLRLRLGAIAFLQRPHMVLGPLEGEPCFYIFFFTGVGYGLGHSHGHGVVAVDLGQRFEWRCAAPKVVLPHLRTPW